MKDMMPSFELFQPASVDNALDLMERFGKDGWLLAGGQDSYDWFKDRAKKPTALIDLNGLAELRGIKETADGVEIGALTTLTEVVNNDLIKSQYGLLADAASRVASPQIRNMGTLGGNLCQDARCWYYRYGLDCYRAGGNTCYADTPQGMNREHCLFEGDRCVAVSPSDTSTAIIALDGSMVVRSKSGEKVVKAEDFFIGPATDITHMTVLRPGDLLTAVRLPKTFAGAKFYFEKVADRNTWDFALVNISAALKVNNGTIEDSRFVCGGVQCRPKRLTVVEDIIKGSPQNEETAELAGKSASRGATPLNYNHFKIPLMQNLVKRAIRSA
jgi:xanthine dehydrogenase YagS FAD-binding subunit